MGLVVLIVAAVLLEALLFAISDGFFARVTARLYRDLRVMMFEGLQRRPSLGAHAVTGLASRFISDAEALQELLVAPLDTAVIGSFQLGLPSSRLPSWTCRALRSR